jgi:hypothetical protein
MLFSLVGRLISATAEATYIVAKRCADHVLSKRKPNASSNQATVNSDDGPLSAAPPSRNVMISSLKIPSRAARPTDTRTRTISDRGSVPSARKRDARSDAHDRAPATSVCGAFKYRFAGYLHASTCQVLAKRSEDRLSAFRLVLLTYIPFLIYVAPLQRAFRQIDVRGDRQASGSRTKPPYRRGSHWHRAVGELNPYPSRAFNTSTTSSISQNRLVAPAAIAEVAKRVTNAHGIVRSPPAVRRGSPFLSRRDAARRRIFTHWQARYGLRREQHEIIRTVLPRVDRVLFVVPAKQQTSQE